MAQEICLRALIVVVFGCCSGCVRVSFRTRARQTVPQSRFQSAIVLAEQKAPEPSGTRTRGEAVCEREDAYRTRYFEEDFLLRSVNTTDADGLLHLANAAFRCKRSLFICPFVDSIPIRRGNWRSRPRWRTHPAESRQAVKASPAYSNSEVRKSRHARHAGRSSLSCDSQMRSCPRTRRYRG